MRDILNRFIFFLFKNTLRKTVVAPLENEIQLLKFQIGSSHFSNIKQKISEVFKTDNPDLSVFEYKVFSQWGQDGIIQFLINYLDIENKSFIEFGSSHYLEANTRFLLMNNSWKGLIIDGSPENINLIKNDYIYWQYNLTAVQSFITKDNINSLIKDAGFEGEIGLLSVDIDGNDYHVWEAIDVVNPIIVIAEYNAAWGTERAISVPYKADFERLRSHYSGVYFGASLPAFAHLAEKKGYSLVYCNNQGNDSFFVRNDKLKNLKSKTAKEAYVENKFRISKDKYGKLNHLSASSFMQDLKGLDVVNVLTKNIEEL